MKNIYLILIGILFFASCGSNKFESPDISIPESYIYNNDMDSINSMVNILWWEKFNDPTLNHLITTALNNNKDLLSAAATLEKARLAIGDSRSSYLPSLDAEFAADMFHNNDNGLVQLWGLGAKISWEVSLFGAMKNSTRAARAAYLSSDHAMRSVMLTIASDVASNYFKLICYKQSLEIAIRSYELRKESTDLIDSLYRYGMASLLNLEQSHSLTYTAAADIPSYERAIVQTSLALNILLGENPQKVYDLGNSPLMNMEDCSELIPQVPIGMPSTLLERRPDVLEAYYSMAEAWAKVGIKRAARYPTISLSANTGVGSDKIGDLFSGKPFIWAALGSITQPIFSFGSNKRAFESAKQDLYSSTASYEKSVISAISEVESSLIAISSYKNQLEEYGKLVKSNYINQQLTSRLYDNGLTSYLEVIDAERSWYESQLEYVNILNSQYTSYVDLYKSLGGGW